MIKNLLILSFVFLYACTGYVPVFSKKTNYKFSYIELEGEKRLNQIIYKNIKNLENPDATDVKLLGLKKVKSNHIKKIRLKAQFVQLLQVLHHFVFMLEVRLQVFIYYH